MLLDRHSTIPRRLHWKSRRATSCRLFVIAFSCLVAASSLAAASPDTAPAAARETLLLDVQFATHRGRSIPPNGETHALKTTAPGDSSWEAGVYWVAFVDKATSAGPALMEDRLRRVERTLNERALIRRGKIDSPVDFADLPVSLHYISKVKATGAEIRVVSRWFNAVSVRAEPAQLDAIARLPCVAFLQPVRIMSRTPPAPAPAMPSNSAKPASRSSARNFYGLSSTHLATINVQAAHVAGWTGAGVRIGLLDTGFDHATHEALEPIQVVGEYDFIQNDGFTADEAGDPIGQDSHGTSVLSLVGGYMPNELIGVAYGAEFVLAKTEIVDQEIRAEMDLFIAGLEYLEASGCDVISASLGYLNFPDEPDIAYEELDGLTLPISIATGMAFDRGVVTVTSAGNSFSYPPSAPNDAFGVISVGQVESDGDLAFASSFGPMVDGRIKPEVCAQGVNAYVADAATIDGYKIFTSGTSYAAPQIAGICALILEANPDWTPLQVQTALLQTASQANAPSNGLGWGIANALAAVEHSGVAAAETWTAYDGEYDPSDAPDSGDLPYR